MLIETIVEMRLVHVMKRKLEKEFKKLIKHKWSKRFMVQKYVIQTKDLLEKEYNLLVWERERETKRNII